MYILKDSPNRVIDFRIYHLIALSETHLKSIEKYGVCNERKVQLKIRSDFIVPPLHFKSSSESNVLDPVLHVTSDNINILTDTLDSKKIFHETRNGCISKKMC